MEKIFLTPEGFAKLEAEHNDLIQNQRPAIIKAISEARELGDLSENAEYHSAKEQQGFIEGRIEELETIIGRAEVIDPARMSGDTIKFGATVSLVDVDTEEDKIYKIVGRFEADLAHGKIALDSPIAKALIGKKAEDEVDVITPSGTKTYEIEKVEYK
ncbi:MAG: transcription elongation factor GreA [Alphaproteobacteria bacterium]|jgi:transcription elongation factor GreA|nr:transcription elongation factor GreA [Alphaproteobacteria bacterium]